MEGTKQRPINFTAREVRGTLDGTKTRIRTPLNPQPIGFCEPMKSVETPLWEWSFGPHNIMPNGVRWWKPPLGIPGELLWVRETAFISPPGWHTDYEGRSGHGLHDDNGRTRVVYYPATPPDHGRMEGYLMAKTPSSQIPKWASRITLEIVDVRVERLQDSVHSFKWPLFEVAWNEKHKKTPALLWNNNPYVWLTEFKRVYR